MKKLTLAKAFEELEKITQELESGDVDLEKGVPKFKRGLELARFIKKRLSIVENEIKEIKDDFKDSAEEDTKELRGVVEEEV